MVYEKGRNLLCIHSKKHIKNPPEQTAQKQAQNLESMKAMGELASKGGQVFWVAPSGGRDRPSTETNQFVVSPFDLKALDMFKLIAMQSKKVTFIILIFNIDQYSIDTGQLISSYIHLCIYFLCVNIILYYAIS